MPVFTVIVPVFNAEKTLRRCVDSILRQKMRDFELILVNDGSTDQSGLICDRYAASDARVSACHQDNRGVSAARNKGLKMATGQYIAFVDADDTISESYLESMMPYDTDLVLCGIKKIDLSTQKEEIISFSNNVIEPITSDDICLMVQNRGLNFCFAKRYINELIKKEDLSFQEDLSLGEDTLFLTEYLAKCQSFAYSDDVSYYYDYSGAVSLSSFNQDYVKNLMESNRREISVLEAVYPDLRKKKPFKVRIWSIFYYSIFYILNEWDAGIQEKYQLLQSIFWMKEFQILRTESDFLMKNDPMWLRKVISKGNPAILIFVSWLINIKKRLIR